MSIGPEKLVRLNSSHVRPASDVLARAFQDYPLLQYAFPDEAAREGAAPYYCQSVLYYAARYGEVHSTSPNMEGIAGWITSDYFPMTLWRMIRSVPASVMTGLGRAGGSRMKYPGEYIDEMHKRLAPFEHWFLLIIGVDPPFQGKGYAGMLMRAMLDRMSEQGLPCYLETMDEKNVHLYEHFGFEVIETCAIPGTELTTWAMLREVGQATDRVNPGPSDA